LWGATEEKKTPKEGAEKTSNQGMGQWGRERERSNPLSTHTVPKSSDRVAQGNTGSKKPPKFFHSLDKPRCKKSTGLLRHKRKTGKKGVKAQVTSREKKKKKRKEKEGKKKQNGRYLPTLSLLKALRGGVKIPMVITKEK